jgi:hypothetical protein
MNGLSLWLIIGFYERGSQDLSNGTNFASELVNCSCFHIYSLWDSPSDVI